MNQLIIDSLQQNKYDEAFRYTFLLHRGPNDTEKFLDKNWSDIYEKKRKNYTVLHVDHFYLLIKHSVLHVTIFFVPFVLPTY